MVWSQLISLVPNAIEFRYKTMQCYTERQINRIKDTNLVAQVDVFYINMDILNVALYIIIWA